MARTPYEKRPVVREHVGKEEGLLDTWAEQFTLVTKEPNQDGILPERSVRPPDRDCDLWNFRVWMQVVSAQEHA